jgi:hypothetical protein
VTVPTCRAWLTERGQHDTDANDRLLSRQATYGLLGIYGNVADNLHLVSDDGLALNADLGGRLGEVVFQALRLALMRESLLLRLLPEKGRLKRTRLERCGAWSSRGLPGLGFPSGRP